MTRGLTGAYALTTIVTPANSVGLTSLADAKLELDLAIILMTSADTPTGNVLPFVSTGKVLQGMAATATNVSAAVQAVGPTSITLAANVGGDVPLGTAISFSDTAHDVWLTKAIAQISRAIERYCHRSFGLATYQDLVRPDHGVSWSGVRPNANPIVLARWPVVSPIVSIVETIASVAQAALVEGADFEVDYAKGEVYRLDQYQRPRNWRGDAVTIQYRAGWQLPNDPPTSGVEAMPDDLEEAALRLLTERWWSAGRDPSLMSEDTASVTSQRWWVGGTPNQNGQFPEEIQRILNTYRVPVLG